MAQEGFLIKQEKYLEAGIHIGTKLRVIDMTRFIYRTRSDGLYVLDLRKVDERIRLAGKLLAHYDPKDIVVVASRTYSSMAANQFAALTGAKVATGRVVPGLFTNSSRSDFVEPKLVIICDPKGERQAVVECGKMGLPTIGLCDTDNFTMYIDWVVPCNNKGRRSLLLIFWLFAREMALSSGKVASYDEFKPTFEEFEAAAQAPPPVAVPEAAPAEGVQAPDVASEAPAETEKEAEAPAESGDDETEAPDEKKDGETDEEHTARKKAKASKPKATKKAPVKAKAKDGEKEEAKSEKGGKEKEAAAEEKKE
ncbi:MAG: 30S ribosomal protein S2 [Candidatus Micrarchaeota archaeon]